MIRTAPFFQLWLTYLLSATAGLMLIGHIVRIADVQAASANGFVIVMVMAVFNTIGRVVGGYLSDSLGRTNALLVVFLIQAVVMFVFTFLNSMLLLAAGIAIAGLAYGALFALFPATTADFFGLKNLGVNYGLIFTSWGVAGIIGPILAGRVVDLTGTYTYSYIVAGTMLLIGAVLIKKVKAPVKKV